MKQFTKVADTPEYDTDGGKLTQRLVHEGLLTKKMVNELKKEWKDSVSKDMQKYEKRQKNQDDDWILSNPRLQCYDVLFKYISISSFGNEFEIPHFFHN